MSIDSNNPIVKLCAEGITAEMAGDITKASTCYMQAWARQQNAFEACIAAHYVARLQNSAADSLHWNTVALAHAGLVMDGSVEAFYPSLYLNVGKAYEDMGNTAEAKRHYELGIGSADILPHDELGNITKQGLQRGLGRVAQQ